jgi:very-short-patch-repair endonuclease
MTKYINGKTKIIIICKQHGIFKQKPTDHLNGCGCPLCKESQGEKQIRVFLEKNNIEFIPQYKFPNCKYKQKLSFDFYIPNRNLCIEFDGEQHFNRFRFENDDVGLNIRKIRDNIKSEYCKNNNIRLIRINCRDNISEILNSQF